MAQLFAGDTIASSPKRSKKTNTCWRYLPDYDLILGSAPKVATSSIREALEDTRQYIPISFDCAAVWVVREPVDRFRSLYHQKCVEGGRVFANGSDSKKYMLKGMSMTELMDFIEEGEVWNTHWATQSELEGGHATGLVPLSLLDDFWRDMGLPPMETKNASQGRRESVPEDIKARVLTYYADDVHLWKKALWGSL